MGACELAIIGLWVVFAPPPQHTFTLKGAIEPAGRASVWLYGANSPFSAFTKAGSDGRFHFSGILPGVYTLTVSTTPQSKWRETIDVGPSVADAKGRVQVSVQLDPAKVLTDPADIVSTRQLSIPRAAWKEYRLADRCLSKRDVEGAVAHLQRATDLAPQLSEAWNGLAIIAYHAHQYAQAEGYFRKGLAADPSEYAPLVNLGGVLLNLGRFEEARNFNTRAIAKQPNDPLAHSQLGIADAALGQLDAAKSELKEAIRLDPHHFTNPQIVLADVYEREHNRTAAVDVLEEFLKLHPDFPQTPQIRERIARLHSGQ